MTLILAAGGGDGRDAGREEMVKSSEKLIKVEAKDSNTVLQFEG